MLSNIDAEGGKLDELCDRSETSRSTTADRRRSCL